MQSGKNAIREVMQSVLTRWHITLKKKRRTRDTAPFWLYKYTGSDVTGIHKGLPQHTCQTFPAKWSPKRAQLNLAKIDHFRQNITVARRCVSPKTRFSRNAYRLHICTIVELGAACFIYFSSLSKSEAIHYKKSDSVIKSYHWNWWFRHIDKRCLAQMIEISHGRHVQQTRIRLQWYASTANDKYNLHVIALWGAHLKMTKFNANDVNYLNSHLLTAWACREGSYRHSSRGPARGRTCQVQQQQRTQTGRSIGQASQSHSCEK